MLKLLLKLAEEHHDILAKHAQDSKNPLMILVILVRGQDALEDVVINRANSVYVECHHRKNPQRKFYISTPEIIGYSTY